MQPMKLTDVGPEAAEAYITDPNWIMQQKMDGARVVAVLRRPDGMEDPNYYTILFTNDGVNEIKFSAAKLHIPALTQRALDLLRGTDITDLILDGELIIETGTYHVFDILSMVSENGGIVVQQEDRLAHRLSYLETLAVSQGLHGDSIIQMSPTAHTEFEKGRLWDRVNTLGVEGAVSKHLNSIYVPGTRSKDWVKHKLVKAADVIVLSVDRTFDGKGMVTHGSAALGVRIEPEEDPAPWVHRKTGKRIADSAFTALPIRKMGEYDKQPRGLLPVGNSSLIGKPLTIDVGNVIEIEYLYFTGIAVIQPRITRERWDKPSEQCRLDQFPAYTRQLAWGGAH